MKAAANLTKHEVSFEEAAQALAADLHEVAFADASDSTRTLSLVLSVQGRTLLVVSAETRVRTRIISARKATPHEQRSYDQARSRS